MHFLWYDPKDNLTTWPVVAFKYAASSSDLGSAVPSGTNLDLENTNWQEYHPHFLLKRAYMAEHTNVCVSSPVSMVSISKLRASLGTIAPLNLRLLNSLINSKFETHKDHKSLGIWSSHSNLLDINVLSSYLKLLIIGVTLPNMSNTSATLATQSLLVKSGGTRFLSSFLIIKIQNTIFQRNAVSGYHFIPPTIMEVPSLDKLGGGSLPLNVNPVTAKTP